MKKFFGVGDPEAGRERRRKEKGEEDSRERCRKCGGREFRYPIEGQYRLRVCMACGEKEKLHIQTDEELEVEYLTAEDYVVRSKPRWREARPADLMRMLGDRFNGGVIVWRSHEED